MIEELKASIKTLSTTEKDAETFALDYCFSQRTSENSKESEAALLARGRLLYYSTRQNDPTQVNGLRQLGQQAAQKAKTSPDTTNASLQLIQQRYAEGTKKSNKAKQSIVDEALSSFETTFEEERKKKEIEIASLISQSASNDNRRNELLARINALKGARKTKENLNPTLYASRVTR